MTYNKSKAANVVALFSIIMILFGFYYGNANGYTANIPLLLTFIVVNILTINYSETNKALIYLLAFAYLADSVVIRSGYFGVNFNFLSPIVILLVAYSFIEKKQLSITLSAVALGMLGLNVIQLIVIEPNIFPALLGPILFFVAALLNILNIHSANNTKSDSDNNKNYDSANNTNTDQRVFNDF